MTMPQTVYCLIASYSDGSGKPEVLRVYQDEDRAKADKEIIDTASPMKNVYIVPAQYFFPDYD